MPLDGRRLLEIPVLRATCGHLPVVLGSARAKDLYEASFADVLDEAADAGYQRPFDAAHSREFRAYIERDGATTIPLTLNLRGGEGEGWDLREQGGAWLLRVALPELGGSPVLARVDCQHRLGNMGDSPIGLTFQCFLGLSIEKEMEIFSVINGKAKGLSSSLLDYHKTKLSPNIGEEQPELHIAKKLNEDPGSVWRGAVKLGGAGTQGSHRKVSLRGLQSATRLFLKGSPLGSDGSSVEEKYRVVRDFWSAVADVWREAWETPRRHLLTKGVGVTALSLLAGDILTASLMHGQVPGRKEFSHYLAPLRHVDWSKSGQFKGFGGRQGAAEVHEILRSILSASARPGARAG